MSNEHIQVFNITDDERSRLVQAYSSPETQDAMQQTIDQFTLPLLIKMHDATLRKDSAILLDMGTGVGDIPIELLEKYPNLKAMIIDANQPNLEIARQRIKQKGIEKRIDVEAGNMDTFETKEKFDVITFVFSAQTSNLIHLIDRYTKMLKPEGELSLIMPIQSTEGFQRGSKEDVKKSVSDIFNLHKLLGGGSFLRGLVGTIGSLTQSLQDGSTKFYESKGYKEAIGPIQRKAEQIQNNHPNILKISDFFKRMGLVVQLNGNALGLNESETPLIHNMEVIKIKKPLDYKDKDMLSEG